MLRSYITNLSGRNFKQNTKSCLRSPIRRLSSLAPAIPNMVLINTSSSSLPSSWQGLTDRLSNVGDSAYIFFICDNDATTGKPWCPDVRAAIPVVQKYFEKRSEEILVVSVGQLPQWKSPQSIFRTKWDLKAIPTLIKYTRTEDGISQKQVVENDVKDEGQLKALVQS